jgi:outer membrane receptor protein involved in Fe transport
MKLKLFGTLTILLLISVSVFSAVAPGTIRGKVTNGETGEILLGATIRLMQDGQMRGGAYTDVEGNYTIKAEPGVYSLIISYVSFLNDTLENIEVVEGAVIYNETLLFENMATREDLKVVITGKRNKGSEVTLFNVKRTSLNTMDGVSKDIIARTGDNDVGQVMQRVTGVTVEGGKYVYVRGLGDRYSNTLLNGAVIPSLDPDRNAVQMDIFPSQLIDNVMVYKTFTPNLPGNFSGGLIDITTRDFPDRLRISVSASTSFNPQANLIDNFLTYETGSTDWRGVDDGIRALPEEIASLPDGVPDRTFNDLEAAQTIDRASKSFSTSMAPTTTTSGLNQRYQASIGNQNLLFGRPFGYIASFTYSNGYNAFTNGRESRWKNTSDARIGSIADNLNSEKDFVVQQGSQSVLWGALAKLSYTPFPNHKISVNLMQNQSGESTARTLEGPIPTDAIDLIFQTRVLGYQERQVGIFQVQGQHAFGTPKDKQPKVGPLKVDWIYSTSASSQSEPDLRFFSNDYTENSDGERIYDIQANLYQEPNRFYRSLEEDNRDARINFELPVKVWNDLSAKFKFGGASTRKERSFREDRYQITQGNISARYNGNPDQYFAEANTGIRIDTIFGFLQFNYRNYIEDVSEERNNYVGTQEINAGYAMLELPVTARINLAGGLRFESTFIEAVSEDVRLDTGLLELGDFLPAISGLYRIKENLNLRGSYARTVARPTFREFSPFVAFSFVGDFVLIGNPNLNRTSIDNYDLRLEWYPTPSELISFSGFYKKFTDPIEKVFEPRAPNQEIIFRNIPEGLAYGVEFEVRKNLDFLAPGSVLRNFQVGGNASLIYSEVGIAPDEYRKILDVDPDRPPTRPIFGQSPYAVNGEIAYIDDTLGIRASLSYNVFGPRIAVVGGTEPDIYEQPRGLLNFSIVKRLPKGFSLTLRARNLLDPEYKLTQTYKGREYVFRSYRIGRSFSVGVSYNFDAN